LLLALIVCRGASDGRAEAGFRFADLPVPAAGKTGFTRLSPEVTGLRFTNWLADARSLTNRNLLSGSGVAAGDLDGDGWCDLFFCRLDGPSALYRNLGQWRFEDVTARAGVACAGQESMGAAFADVDGDGDLDLLINALNNGTRLFQNDGRGAFRETTATAGLASKSGSMSMALADVDGDGDLDLYVANYRPTTLMDRPGTRFTIGTVQGKHVVTAVDGKPTTSPELAGRFGVSESGSVVEFGEVDVLCLNNGQGVFTPLSFTNGAFLDEAGQPLREPPRDWSLSVQLHDLNGDGAPDIYLCSDLFTPDRIWINDGAGRFRALPTLALRNTSTFSMGRDFGDLDRDGDVDFLVVDMLSPDHSMREVQSGQASPMFWPVGVYETRPQLNRNTLQIHRGDGTFAEIAYYAGLEATDWSWHPLFLDVDLDGYEDILVPTGQLRDFQNADLNERLAQMQVGRQVSQAELFKFVAVYPSLHTPNLAFRNRGDLTFEQVGARWGFNTRSISQGACLADLDGDGDLDVAVNNLNEAAGLYRNEGVGARLAVRLRGAGANSGGVGARITVRGGAVPVQSQEMMAGGRYLSCDQGQRVFAAGSATNALTLEVRWRSGARSVVTNARANRLYEVVEATPAGAGSRATAGGPASGSAGVSPASSGRRDAGAPSKGAVTGAANALAAQAPLAPPWFEDVSERLGHRHAEEPFDDFARQLLLPWRLSQLGPGVGWHDVDGDGAEELVVGSGKGGTLAVYRAEEGGGWTRLTNAALGRALARDQSGVVGMGSVVLVGSANYEDGLTNGGSVRV
jgi:hypothetical protein